MQQGEMAHNSSSLYYECFRATWLRELPQLSWCSVYAMVSHAACSTGRPSGSSPNIRSPKRHCSSRQTLRVLGEQRSNEQSLQQAKAVSSFGVNQQGSLGANGVALIYTAPALQPHCMNASSPRSQLPCVCQ